MENQIKTRISFDMDGTLGHVPYIQNLCKCLLLDPSNEVLIITRRYNHVNTEYGDEMTQVFNLAGRLGIKKENVHFTNREYKVGLIKQLDVDIHYDDDFTEIQLIRQHFPKCKGFRVFM
jgi:hypothetical protein